MKNNDHNKNVEGFINCSKICIITAITTGVFGIILALLTILKEFTDFEVAAPYLYSRTFAWIMLAIFLVLVTLMMICVIKARKYKKLIEKSENNKNEEVNEQNDSDR